MRHVSARDVARIIVVASAMAAAAVPVVVGPPPAGAIATTWTATDIVNDLSVAPAPANGATSVAVGDIDGDGDLDLASSSDLDDTIAWYENDGTANFSAANVATSADAAVSVAIGDLDGDGDLDLASASISDDTIAWYENDGAGNFSATDIATSADGASSVAIGDLDGDGDLDLASSSRNDDAISWYENTAGDASAWTAADIVNDASGGTAPADFAHLVTVGDLDGDGDLDLASASQNDSAIAWYENDGAADPAFTPADIVNSSSGGTLPASGAWSVTTGDLDGDGDLDLASAGNTDDAIAWYENDGAGNFSATDIATTADGARSVTAVDVDSDGDLDLASASNNDDTIAWYENTAGDGSAWTATDIALDNDSATFVTAGDLDGDGDADLAATSYVDDTVAWFENGLPARSTPAFAQADVDTTLDGPNFTEPADVDGDGDVDMVAASQEGGGRLSWLVNDGTSGPWTPTTVQSDADSFVGAAAGDIDGDGDIDLASGRFNDDAVAWHENTSGDGSTWTTMDIVNSSSGLGAPADAVAGVDLGDLDGDGDLDIVSASANDDAVSWYENDAGDGSSWTFFDIVNSSSGGTAPADEATSVGVGDVDGDGDLDVMSTSGTDNAVSWYENNGAANPTFTPADVDVDTTGRYPVSVTAGDFDGDGDLDLGTVDGQVSTSAVTWYENTSGDGSTWARNDIVDASDGAASPNGAQAMRAGDLDGDGDLDLASASANDGAVSWYRNNGAANPTFTPSDIVNSVAVDGTTGLSLADYDGDGDNDLAAVNGDPRITVHQALPGLSVADVAVSEGGTLTFTVDAGRLHENVSVQATTSDGTAVAGSDYTSITNQAVNLNAGTTSQTFDVVSLEDGVDEPNQTFTVTLGSPTNAGLVDGTATGTITDDDATPVLSIGDASVSEGGTVTFTVTASHTSSSTMTVKASTANGSAVAGSDYTARTGVTVTLPAGTTSRTLGVSTIEDGKDERNETFFVNLSTPSSATLTGGDAQGRGTITDDDPPPSITIGNRRKLEGDSSTTRFRFVVELSRRSGKTVRVDFKTVARSATAGSDYQAKSGTLTFLPGKKEKGIVVRVNGDLVVESDERFRVKLSNPRKATIADGVGVGKIRNDD